MFTELNNYDWAESFGYAGESGACEYALPEQPMFVEGVVSLAPITREDVEEIKHISLGENDERSWLIVGQVKDGRWFYLEAGCDYTGWDCQASGRCFVTESYEDLIRWAIGKSERERLGIELSELTNNNSVV